MGVLTGICLLAGATSAFAGGLGSPPRSLVPQEGFFVGAGGSFNWARIDQSLKGVSGTSDVFIDSVLVASGQAGGPAADFNRDDSAFAPDVQTGYFERFAASPWLAGLKFTYKYLHLTSDDRNIVIPHAGSFTTKVGTPTTVPFTGDVPIKNSQIRIDHELLLLPFIGRSFGNSFVYLGGGPALFGTHSKIVNAVGFADIHGMNVDVTGAPVNFSSSDWVWGGAGQVGLDYYLSPTWFLDLNYTFAMSAAYKNKYSSGYTNTNGPVTSVGTANIIASQQFSSQSFTVSINKVF